MLLTSNYISIYLKSPLLEKCMAQVRKITNPAPSLEAFIDHLRTQSIMPAHKREGLIGADVSCDVTRVNADDQRAIYSVIFGFNVRESPYVNRLVWNETIKHDHDEGAFDTRGYAQGRLQEMGNAVKKSHPIYDAGLKIVDGKTFLHVGRKA